MINYDEMGGITKEGLQAFTIHNGFISPTLNREIGNPFSPSINQLSDEQLLYDIGENWIPVDNIAQEKSHDQKMSNKAKEEWLSGKGFSLTTKEWLFRSLFGNHYQSQLIQNSIPQPQLLGAETIYSNQSPSDLLKRNEKPSFLEFTGQNTNGMLDNFPVPEASFIQGLIAKADKDPNNPYEKILFGGGLPEDESIMEFKKLLDLALQEIISWNPSIPEDKPKIRLMLQYAKGLAGENLHLKSVFDHYLELDIRNKLKDIYGVDKCSESMLFTAGSQKVIDVMLQSVVISRKDKTKPAVLVTTDPVYPGMLIAAEKYLKQGLLKIKVVPIDVNGNIDRNKLDKALADGECQSIYLSEGNPFPKQINNKIEISDLIDEKYSSLVIFEDRAYRGIGLDSQNSFINIAPHRTFAFETLSKTAAPGMRFGFGYTGMQKENSTKLMNTFRQLLYKETLGFPGILGATVYALMEVERKTGKFTQHIEKTSLKYARKRQLYLEAYKEALDIFHQGKKYDIDNEVIVDIGMFGWRKTSVPSYKYTSLCADEIGVFSLPGSECIPKADFIIDPTESTSHLYLRQNLTWEDDISIRIGAIKDTIAQTFFSKKSAKQKERIIGKLIELAEYYGGGPRSELRKFLDNSVRNKFKYPFST